MLFDYIEKNFKLDDPIFIDDIPGSSRNYVRQELKKLCDEGKIERLSNGVYFRPYTTILGTKGRISIDKYLEKKYLFVGGSISGYITGLQLANYFSLTTQNPACYEICSNAATTKFRKIEIDKTKVKIYKPVAMITSENVDALQYERY